MAPALRVARAGAVLVVDALTARQQVIVTISALTAKGDLPRLHHALGDATARMQV